VDETSERIFKQIKKYADENKTLDSSYIEAIKKAAGLNNRQIIHETC
jgi:hypothetical protein